MSVRRFRSGLVWGALLLGTSSAGWAAPLVVSELEESAAAGSTPAETTSESHDLQWWKAYGGLGTEAPSIYAASSASLSDVDAKSLVALPTLVNDDTLVQLQGVASLGEMPARGAAVIESVDPLALSLSEVPEPATLGLVLSGLSVLSVVGVRMLRKRSKGT